MALYEKDRLFITGKKYTLVKTAKKKQKHFSISLAAFSYVKLIVLY